jgi:nucleotide-binding universal stress UspA family protein
MKILIALDYDPSAQKIAEEGYALGKAMGAEVTLLHMVSDPVYYATRSYTPIMGFDGYLDTSPQDLENIDTLVEASYQYLEKTRKFLGDESIQTRVAEGDPAEAILQISRESGFDIIVMGPHNQKWLEKIVMGSATEKVLRNSTIPLYIIPAGKTEEK